LNIQACW